MNRVVITGMGIYSCLGSNLDEVKTSLQAGKSGIGIDPVRTDRGFRSALTGILPTPDLKKLLKRRMRVGMGQESEYGETAASGAGTGESDHSAVGSVNTSLDLEKVPPLLVCPSGHTRSGGTFSRSN